MLPSVSKGLIMPGPSYGPLASSKGSAVWAPFLDLVYSAVIMGSWDSEGRFKLGDHRIYFGL